MDYFEDIYLKRLNRFGTNYQDRIQNKREADFELYLLKSNYLVEFLFQGLDQIGILERHKQDSSETFMQLLTRRNLTMPRGTLLTTKNYDNKIIQWMIYYQEDTVSSGYNKYILLKMPHAIDIEVDGKTHHLPCYMKGPGKSVIADTIKSDKSSAVYLEDFNKYILILPKTPLIQKDTYFTIGDKWERTGFRVTGFDIFSDEGIEYVTIDPLYIRDESPVPEKTPEDDDNDFFWLNGGAADGS